MIDDLARADPLPRIISWLGAHTTLAAELGGLGRVSLYNEPPFPCIRIVDVPGGNDRQLTWLIYKAVQVEAYGDLSGAPGKAQLHRALYVALGALKQLPQEATPVGGPVITEVRSVAAGTWSPEPTGQPRYVATVNVWSHATP